MKIHLSSAPKTGTKAANDKECSKVQGMFVFGSSLVDNGNNNFLVNSLAKANYLPYGDLQGDTNGKNVVDLLGDNLKIPVYIPTFNDPSTKGSKIIHGVNFASGGSDILDDTGAARELIIEITSLNIIINKAQFVFPRLYDMGPRKFVLMALYPNGCSPMARPRNPMATGCIQSLNSAAQLFNTNLRSLVDSIRLQMPGSKLVLVNAYKIIMDILENPTPNGFSDTKNPCCEVATTEEGGTGTLCWKFAFGGEAHALTTRPKRRMLIAAYRDFTTLVILTACTGILGIGSIDEIRSKNFTG
ncbi:hypothetical protein RND71_005916 [Anisodus tanguticus]|uniref:Uncharacterized protein n=1 Tax=Anisodus tanguticus TaxID=243964 RepID=A0AAE1SR06_9SOLA|nr:hypothetical protein RND71_005916 [Anisodus tanguticus]